MLSNIILMPITGLMLASADPAPLCQNYIPEVEVSPIFGPVSEDHTLRAADLTAPDAWGTLMIDHITGVTQFSAQSEFQTHDHGTDSCVAIQKVTIAYRMDSTTRIKNEFPEGSCQHTQIKLHKEHHEQVAKDFVTHSVPLVKQFLLNTMKGRSAINVGGRKIDEIQSAMQQTLNSELATFAQYLNEEHRKLQRQIVDSPEEVKKMFAACSDWTPPESHP
jgi:hypothetical protein